MLRCLRAVQDIDLCLQIWSPRVLSFALSTLLRGLATELEFEASNLACMKAYTPPIRWQMLSCIIAAL